MLKMLKRLFNIKDKYNFYSKNDNACECDRAIKLDDRLYYSTRYAAAADITAFFDNKFLKHICKNGKDDRSIVIKPGEVIKIPTGIYFSQDIDNNCYLYHIIIYSKSGIATNNQICLATGVSIIDADYTGEIILPIVNNGKKKVVVNHMDAIAQLIIVREKKEEGFGIRVKNTERNSNGFGSSLLIEKKKRVSLKKDKKEKKDKTLLVNKNLSKNLEDLKEDKENE